MTTTAGLRIAVLVPPLHPRHGTHRRGDDSDRHRARRARPRGARRLGPALVSHAFAVEPGWRGTVGAAGDDRVGFDHADQPVRRRRQTQPRPAGGRVRRVQRTGGAGLVARSTGRRCHRHVAATHARPHRVVHSPDPPRPADLQHPRRVSRRRRADRGDHQPVGHCRRRSGWNGSATTVRLRSPCSATTSATTWSQRCVRRGAVTFG